MIYGRTKRCRHKWMEISFASTKKSVFWFCLKCACFKILRLGGDKE